MFYFLFLDCFLQLLHHYLSQIILSFWFTLSFFTYQIMMHAFSYFQTSKIKKYVMVQMSL